MSEEKEFKEKKDNAQSFSDKALRSAEMDLKAAKSNAKVKENKRKLSGIEISLIVCACVLFVLIILSFFGSNILKSVANINADSTANSKVVNEVFYRLMPKEVEGSVNFEEAQYDDEGNMTNGIPVTYHVIKNENFDYETDQGIDFFDFYYIDQDGNRVGTTEDGHFESGVIQTKFEVLFGFTLKTVERVDKIITGIHIARIILIILFFVDLIALWFVEFSISEDRKKAKAYSNKPPQKKKKKK